MFPFTISKTLIYNFSDNKKRAPAAGTANAQAEDVGLAHLPIDEYITSFCRKQQKGCVFMSFDLLRSDFASRLFGIVSPEIIPDILSALDRSVEDYEISPRKTDLIVREDFLKPVRNYIASKSVENLARGTLYNYYLRLSHFIGAILRPVREITSVNIRVYLDNYKKATGVSDCTLENIRIIIKSFFTWCVDEGIISQNPCNKIKPIRYADNSRQPMTTMELEKIRKACVNPRETALVEVLYSSAARISEIANMKLSDISFSDKTVVIPHGKGDKRRISYLSAKAILAIRSYLSTRDDDCEYLFVNVRGPKHKIAKKSLEEVIRKIVERTDIKTHVTPHVFRTTSSTHALDSGMPIEQVQRFLGHAKIETTLRYAKVNDADLRRSHQKYFA